MVSHDLQNVSYSPGRRGGRSCPLLAVVHQVQSKASPMEPGSGGGEYIRSHRAMRLRYYEPHQIELASILGIDGNAKRRRLLYGPQPREKEPRQREMHTPQEEHNL